MLYDGGYGTLCHRLHVPQSIFSLEARVSGGEPLLNFDLVRYIVESARRREQETGRNVSMVICSNLALISESILQFCEKNNVHFSTSLDGPCDLHNHNRPSAKFDSYERARTGIGRVREALGVGGISALMTTTNASLSRPKKTGVLSAQFPMGEFMETITNPHHHMRIVVAWLVGVTLLGAVSTGGVHAAAHEPLLQLLTAEEAARPEDRSYGFASPQPDNGPVIGVPKLEVIEGKPFALVVRLTPRDGAVPILQPCALSA